MTSITGSLSRPDDLPTPGNLDDMCPICKSSRYLNPNMKFLVNPECYHKMCESCVDRIFSLGPAPCPYSGCGKILRKNRFKVQVFEDIEVEREVDVRQRVAKTFNKRQEDFQSLEEYNDYLEEVETIIFNLVNKIDVEETEKKLQGYEAANRSQIMANSLRQKQEDDQMEQIQVFEAERKRNAYLLEVQAQQEEEEIRQQARKELVRRLATSEGDADAIERSISKSVLKRSSARRKQLEQSQALLPRHLLHLGKGTKEKDTVVQPFTPFNGDRQKSYLFDVQDEYYDPMLDEIKDNKQYLASGFDVKEAYRLALVQAFFGLGCMIEAEKTESEQIERERDQVNSTEPAAVAAP